METLIIYDEQGYVISTESGDKSLIKEPDGIPFLWVDMPERKRIKYTDGIGVDVSVTPHQVILEDVPPSETEVLKQQMAMQEQAIADLTMYIATIGV